MQLDKLLDSAYGRRPEVRAQLRKEGFEIPFDPAIDRVGGSQDPECQPVPVRPLDKGSRVQPGRKKRVGVIVTIVSFRSRATDEDNWIAGAKPCRDAIATSLGIDDGDPRIKWNYQACIGPGQEGTLVKIDLVRMR